MPMFHSHTPFRASLLGVVLTISSGNCTGAGERGSGAEAEIKALVMNAYDLSKGDVVRRFMSVYPSSGRVVSIAGERITTTRDSLQMSINAFWDGVGQYMIDPTWTWDRLDVETLGEDVAVLTARYTVPHWTDRGAPHVIGGTWTAIWRRTPEGWRVVHEHLSDMPRAVAERIEVTMPRRDSTARDTTHRH